MEGAQAIGAPRRRDAPAGRRAYDPTIAGHSDDLSLRIERLFDEQPLDDGAPPTDVEPDGALPRPAGTERATTELAREMDLLHEQLEAAFAEVVGQVDRIGLRLAALRQASDAHTEALKRLEERSEATQAVADDLVATLDAAVAASREPWEPEPLDLGPIVARLDHLDEAVASAHRELVRFHETPLTLDTRRLEDVASRGSLHNAADIANLRRDLVALTESARAQDRSLREVRATVEWIKDRLLR